MALPKINTFPMYSTTVPSTQQQIRFRPFNVGEEKILLIAFESDDRSHIAEAILDIVLNCIEEKLDPDSLTVFDVEYLFLQIRSKAVGETSNIAMACQSCEHQNQVIVKLEEINIDVNSFPEKRIKINDEYTIDLKFPGYKQIIDNKETLEVDNINELVFQMLIMCLDKLHTPDELLDFNEEPKEEIEEFINNLSSDQYAKMMEFVQDLPKLSQDVEYKCESCGEENKYTLEGLSDFF